MADTYINIDPDGDTLIILPLVQPASETDDAAWERSSLFNDNNDMDGRSSHSDEDEMRGNSSLSSDDGMEDEPSFPEYMPPETLSCYGMKETNLYKPSLDNNSECYRPRIIGDSISDSISEPSFPR